MTKKSEARAKDLFGKDYEEFCEVDPFNPKNEVQGYISRKPNEYYGALIITKINNESVPEQLIMSSPKMHYPFGKTADGTRNYNFPTAKSIEIYEKIDGTCIIAYPYTNGVDRFFSYKTRLRPFLRAGKFGDFPSMWRETSPPYLEEIKKLMLVKECNLVFELYGCVALGTKVLTDDLRWVAVETLKTGDKLVSIDENPTHNHTKRPSRYWRRGTVLHSYIEQQPSALVEFSDGTTLITSLNHPWFTKNNRWITTNEMLVHLKGRGRGKVIIKRIFKPWKSRHDYKGGWVAGFWDGEGSTSPHDKKRTRIVATQYRRDVAEVAIKHLNDCGYDAKYDGKKIYVNGGKTTVMRFIGEIRPFRMLKNFDIGDFGIFCVGEWKQDCNLLEVISVTNIGMQDVVHLGVDTKTYIANGFIMHNSQNPHLILYKNPLDIALLFGVTNAGRILSPTDLGDIGSIPVVNPFKVIDKDYVWNYEEIQRELEGKLTEEEDGHYSGTEGTVWYLKTPDGKCTQIKNKPETIETIHFASGAGGLCKNSVIATCWNALENTDTLTIKFVEQLLLEEFTPEDIESNHGLVERCIAFVISETEFRERVLSEYKAIGKSILLHKQEVMRSLSAKFDKGKMRKVYGIITAFG